MSKTKRTPGPWKARDYANNEGGVWIDCDAYANKGKGRCLGGTICNVYKLGDPTMQAANAALIAAAPDLLEALQGLNYYGEIGNGFCCCPRQNWQDDDSLHSTACADARRAIRKAEGRP